MGDVIYHDFTPTKPKPKKANQVTGVFVKPCGSDETFFSLGGNIGGIIASYTAFHPEFNPSLFGAQVRREMGINVVNDHTPPDAA